MITKTGEERDGNLRYPPSSIQEEIDQYHPTLVLLGGQMEKRESCICCPFARMRVEREMACHLFASQCLGEPKEALEELRKTGAAAPLEHGMDIKTLNTIIGHVSSATHAEHLLPYY